MTKIEMDTSSSSSALVKETASITWTLDNFPSLSGHCESAVFSPPNNSARAFQVGFWLKARPYSDNVFIYLYLSKATDAKLDLEYEVSIVGSSAIDNNNQKFYTKMFQCSYDKSLDYPYCFASFISYKRLINEANGFMVDKRLTLFCEVKILKNRISSDNISGVMFDITISENFGTLLESGKFADTVLVVGGRTFAVHKAILAAQSAVFGAMFGHGETKEAQEGRVELVDICAEVLELLLRYIYTGEIVNMKEYAEELLVAADKYQLESLKSLCVQSLGSSLTAESVIRTLILADMHNAGQLKAACLEYITTNSVQVMKPEVWKLLNQSRPELLMELYQDMSAKLHPLLHQ